MAAALTLQDCGERARNLFLYDTFSGMNQPTEADRFPDGTPAAVEFKRTQTTADTSEWCCAPMDEVAASLRSTGYPEERLRLIKGKVEDTLPGTLPEQIALLRLDTDWYESTRHELRHLFPRLVPHGVLIIDDYGYWSGARQAVDEFMREQNRHFYLHRADQSSRVILNCPAVKPPPA
jgi:O-methyltransferase